MGLFRRRGSPCVATRGGVSALLIVGGLAAAGQASAAASVDRASPVKPAPTNAPTDDHTNAVATYKAKVAAEPGNPEWRFRLGMALVEQGEPRKAIAQFRHVLNDHPEAVRVRLELARAYYLARDFGNAERQFRLARSSNLPAVVAANVDNFLKSIRGERNWSFSASFAIAPDSNINAATNAESIEIYGLPFDLSEDARRSSGVGLSGQVGGEWAPRISTNVRQRFGLSVSRREYQGERFDDMTVSAYSGPRINLGAVGLALAATASRRWYGGHPYNRAIGGQAELAYFPSARSTFSVQASAMDLRHESATYLNGPLYSLTLGATHGLDKQSLGNLRLGLTRHDAANRAFAQTSVTLALLYARDLPAGFSISLQPAISRSRFDEKFAAFGAARRDTNYSLALSALNRKLTLGRFAPRIGFTQVINDSNIPLYAFHRTRVDFGVTTIF